MKLLAKILGLILGVILYPFFYMLEWILLFMAETFKAVEKLMETDK